MPKYRVVRGTHRRSDGTVAEAGTDDDIVEMDEELRDRFASQKFRAVAAHEIESESEEAETEVESVVEESDTESDTTSDTTDTDSEQDGTERVDDVSVDVSDESVESDEVESAEDSEQPDVDSVIPDEYRILSRMAAEYEGDEMHGAMAGDEITAFLETLTVPEVQELRRKSEADIAGD